MLAAKRNATATAVPTNTEPSSHSDNNSNNPKRKTPTKRKKKNGWTTTTTRKKTCKRRCSVDDEGLMRCLADGKALRSGTIVAVAPDSQIDPFWLAQLSQDCHQGAEAVRVRWIEPEDSATWETFRFGDRGAIALPSLICTVSLIRLTPKGKATRWCIPRGEKIKILRIHIPDHFCVEWIYSHLQPDKMIWSSHPTILKPDIEVEFSEEEKLLQQQQDEEEEFDETKPNVNIEKGERAPPTTFFFPSIIIIFGGAIWIKICRKHSTSLNDGGRRINACQNSCIFQLITVVWAIIMGVGGSFVRYQTKQRTATRCRQIDVDMSTI